MIILKDVNPIGTAELNHRYSPPKGIRRAESPCWCNLDKCYCMSDVINATYQSNTSIEYGRFETNGKHLLRKHFMFNFKKINNNKINNLLLLITE